MDKKSILVTALAILLTGHLYAQQKPKINIWDPPIQKNVRTLEVGDAVPNFKIAKIFNDLKNNADFSEYRDKLVIFDFGNLYCKGCVEALPHMDSLQKKFGDKIKIFWVTPEYEEEVRKFWSRENNPFTKDSKISTIVEDSTVRAYFKHKTWPHEAWVYKGKLIALTNAQYVDKHNIEKVLNGDKINWPIKDDFYSFDQSRPLFLLNKDQVDTSHTIIRYSAISDYKVGSANSETFSGGSGTIRNPQKKTIRIFFVNQPIYNSYVLNYLKIIKPGMLMKPSSYGISPNEVAWEVADKSKYTYIDKTVYQMDWIRKNGICFESLSPDTGQSEQEIAKSVIANLNHLLRLNVRWEKRRQKVFILFRTTNTNKFKSKTILKENEKQLSTKNGMQKLRAAELSLITFKMNQQPGNPYVFDETGYPSKVDMDLFIPSWTDTPAIRKALRRYGFDLKEEERLVDILVFSELN